MPTLLTLLALLLSIIVYRSAKTHMSPYIWYIILLNEFWIPPWSIIHLNDWSPTHIFSWSIELLAVSSLYDLALSQTQLTHVPPTHHVSTHGMTRESCRARCTWSVRWIRWFGEIGCSISVGGTRCISRLGGHRWYLQVWWSTGSELLWIILQAFRSQRCVLLLPKWRDLLLQKYSRDWVPHECRRMFLKCRRDYNRSSEHLYPEN